MPAEPEDKKGEDKLEVDFGAELAQSSSNLRKFFSNIRASIVSTNSNMSMNESAAFYDLELAPCVLVVDGKCIGVQF